MWILPSNLRKRSTNVGGSLLCPNCDSNKIKKIDHFPPDRDVYKCFNNNYINPFTKRKQVCGKLFTYVTTPMSVDEPERLTRKENNPYGHINRGKNAWLGNVPLLRPKMTVKKKILV